ncbi:monovalent cation/H(+) antiporter subunit G [Robertmurraya andreesenii]|uniref:Multicomponent Na+:H+ antiporter subunit G n=1 Tax=Anoxybacillus andreesenii TaxID=1325932 RepID=A0ABT9V7A3_9BACL|nr:monovalent cation/H(+) antiporter subunit G [Robertmurraya andreesenii]MDQ0156836.1 multicomponent Na+:H+ antiporter subunit G [Robertmurraya andreesenii]
MSGSSPSEFLPVLLILIGTVFSLLSAIGLIRLPDVYTRSHAASKSATLGVLFALIGTFLFFLLEEGFFSIRLFLGIFFVFLTAPVAAHVILRSAYRANVELAEQSVQDDLKEVLEGYQVPKEAEEKS